VTLQRSDALHNRLEEALRPLQYRKRERVVSKRERCMDVSWGAYEKMATSSIIRFESRSTISQPTDAVFERLADLRGYEKWMHRTGLFRYCTHTSEGPVAKGTTYLDATRMGTFHGEVTDFEPPSRIGFRETLRLLGSETMEARPKYFLEEDQDGTIVHHIAEGELFGWMRLMKPVAALMARSERARTVESLRRSLESD
jgi:uncharacterized protein YndB with AHSA1/START domain